MVQTMSVARFLRKALGAAALCVLATTAACGASDDGVTDGADAITSVTARARTLEFVGTIYVDPLASDATILANVRKQAQSAFGPLQALNIAVNSRELHDIDTTTFSKRTVRMVDPNMAADSGRDVIEIRYTYRDNAVVSAALAERSAVPLALMNPDYADQIGRVLSECTFNDAKAQEYSNKAWYVFNPTLTTCQEAIRSEQEQIDADRRLLKDPANQLAKSDVRRLYLPIEAKLGADKTNRGDSYPEYARLYAGGVQPNKLVISLVYGKIDHTPDSTPPTEDSGWKELMTTLEDVMESGGDLKPVAVQGQPAVDLAHFTLASGKKVTNPSFKDLVTLGSGGSELELDDDEREDLEAQFGARIFRKWIGVERTVSVKIGSAAPRDVGVQFLVYFGAEVEGAPHHFATKNSDVYLYNGHSYAGRGPLNASNFSPADFPSTYQLIWFDSCVSYNYYEKDFLALKEGGTKNLDLMTNAIEAPSLHSGAAMGSWLTLLLSGSGASYKDLLLAAEDSEGLRVVDGELDNEFTPAKYPMTVTPR